MKNLSRLIVSAFLLITCLTPFTVMAQKEMEKTSEEQNDESAVKAAVDAFLLALGNDDQEEVKKMFLPNANIASISVSNGESKIFTINADQYIAQREAKQNRKFQEPVKQYTVNISQGRLAFVRANATVYYDGKASHHTDDFFILMKDNGVWKFLSGSYTSHPIIKDN